MNITLQGFNSVFGEAQGCLEEPIPCALLPFVFILHSTDDGKSLRLHISDFHSNTWQTIRTTELLEELRDQVGIGGSRNDFLQYFRDAFSSANVKLTLGGPASSIGGHGATSANIVAQKSKGMPRITLSLEKLTGSHAEDAMGLIAMELLKVCRHQSDVLEAEQKAVFQLKDALIKSKEETNILQQQVDVTSYRGKRRGRVGASQFAADTIGASISPYDAKDGSTQDTSRTTAEASSAKATTGRAVPLRNKVHMAHAKRAKQRGSRLADAAD